MYLFKSGLSESDGGYYFTSVSYDSVRWEINFHLEEYFHLPQNDTY